MRLDFITINPNFIKSYLEFGVFNLGIKKGLLEVGVHNLRDFASNDFGHVDDRPFGGGDGMILSPIPLGKALDACRAKEKHVIFPSPSGVPLTQKRVTELAAMQKNLLFICGRYSGIDQRIIDHYVDEEISLGDYILSGGELAALAIGDTILRLVPTLLGNEDSPLEDSFAEGLDGQLEYPSYTRPRTFAGLDVPEVLLSGDHKKIAAWKRAESQKRTLSRRPDLLSH